ncbi:LIV-I protein F [Raoultella planticola]|uniref:LIV-I protein F n=1 Tax=Raoultella planticola TaxID=575 RepID=A0A485AU21_RAOPL|nr:LIV-I protein F [Raoultella planticola]
MLSLRAVNQYYGNQHTLWNVDLELQPGECTCVMGLQGMGKTTLVNCITGHLPVASGSMTWHDVGSPPCDITPPLRPFPFDYWHRLCPAGQADLFSTERRGESAYCAGRRRKPRAVAVKGEIYDFFPDLYGRRQHKAAMLSEDDQYQLALARALVVRPRLLILDEPSRGSGQHFVHKLGDLLVRLNRDIGLTVLLAEQHLPFIRRVADRFCLLHRGRNVAQGRVIQLDEPLLAQWMTPDPAR